MLDPAQHIALGDVAGRGIAIEPHRHRALRRRIVRRVEPAAAQQGIRAIAAHQRIVAKATVQHIGIVVAGQLIVERTAGEVLDPREHVALGIAAVAKCAVERDLHRPRARGVGGGIDAQPADQRIRPRAADQHVVAAAAFEQIAAGAADQRIVELAADRMFDIADHIALRVAAQAHRAIEMDLDRLHRGRIVDRVEARAAIDGIRAAPAQQGIVARAAQQNVVRRPADQEVVESRSLQPLDRDIGVAQCVARLVRPVERGGDRAGGPGVGGNVNAIAAVEHVGPRAAFQCIVARAAQQRFIARRADEVVGLRRAFQHFDIGVGVALGIAAVAGAAIEKDLDADSGSRKVDRVGARAAIDMVRARAAGQGIVAGIADQNIVMRRADQHLDAAEHIALGIAALARRAIEMDLDPRRGSGIVRRIDPRAPVQRICPAPADQQVVARAAIQLLVRRRTDDRVGAFRTNHVLDADQRIALGGAAVAGAAIKVDLDPRKRARVDTVGHFHPVEGMGVGDGVKARAAVDMVGPRAAVEKVVRPVADQRVVVLAADNRLDIGVGITLGIAARALARAKVDHHPGVRHVVGNGIEARAAVDLVGPGPGMNGIVAIAGVDHIARRVGEQDLDRVAGNRVLDRHVGVGGDRPDPEMARNFSGESAVLAI